MNYILDSFLSLWWYWMFVSFGLGIIGFGILLYVQYEKPENKRKPLITGGLLLAQVFATWIIAFGLAWVLEVSARAELKKFLNNPNIQVKLNGESITQEFTNQIINELKKVDNIMAHHSSPTENINIELISPSANFQLILSRDSEIPTEYWVYMNKYRVTSNNEIGRITSSIFDKTEGSIH